MDTADSVVDDMVDRDSFEVFLRASEQRLRVALIAVYGAVDGHTAALDALSWAWENWPKVQAMDNPVGYLFRVGQTAARRARSRPIPFDGNGVQIDDPSVSPELIEALAELSAQQRLIVLLVYAFGWTIREVAALLEIAPSTVQTHAERALARLRHTLEDTDDH
jgi:RNA polymerase sigma-70 factor (ECF subfamily)